MNRVLLAIITLSIIINVSALTVMLSCTSPARKNYTCEECYLASECLYYMRKSADKSVCVRYVDACVSRLSEAAYRARVEYCRKIASECRGGDCIAFRECIK